MTGRGGQNAPWGGHLGGGGEGIWLRFQPEVGCLDAVFRIPSPQRIVHEPPSRCPVAGVGQQALTGDGDPGGPPRPLQGLPRDARPLALDGRGDNVVPFIRGPKTNPPLLMGHRAIYLGRDFDPPGGGAHSPDTVESRRLSRGGGWTTI